MAIEIWNGSQWQQSIDPEVYTSTGWSNIMEGHVYIGNSTWSRFYVRVTPVAPTVSYRTRTTSSLTFRYSHPGDASGVYLVLKLVRVSDGVTVAGPESTATFTGTIGPTDKTYTGLALNTQYRFEAYAVYSAYALQSTTATVNGTTQAFTPIAPTLSLSSRTASTITVNAQVSSGSPYNTRVVIWNDTTQSALNAGYVPSTSGTVGAINGNYSSSGLSDGTSYTFAAYTEYRDASTLVFIDSSDITYFTTSTLSYIITTPTTPTNTDRGTTTLDFTASSNANYTTNGATAFIEFSLYRSSTGTLVQIQDSTNLPNNNTSTSRTVQFIGLTQGATYYCRARTVYNTPVNQNSSYSGNSATVSTLAETYVSTGSIAANNAIFISSRTYGASSNAENSSASYSSDDNTSTDWTSDPFTTVSSSVSLLGGAVTRTPTRVRYSTPSTNPITNATTISVSPGVFTLRQGATQRNTYTTPTGRFTDIREPSADFAWDEGSSITLGPTPVPGLPGTRTLTAIKSATQIQFPTPAAPLTGPLSPDGWVNIPTGINMTGPRPGLSASNDPVASYSMVPLSGTIVEVPSASIPTTQTFTAATVTSSNTLTVNGQAAKNANTDVGSGPGFEYVEFTFTAGGASPRMGPNAPSNVVTVTIGSLGATGTMNIEVFLSDSNGVLQSIGSSTNLGTGAIRSYNISSQRTGYGTNSDQFKIKILCSRADSGFGFISSIREVKFSYTYLTLA